MCHGGPGLWDMFGSLAATLPGHFRVIRWDQRGCGRSEHRGPYRVARSAADLDAVRSHLDLETNSLARALVGRDPGSAVRAGSPGPGQRPGLRLRHRAGLGLARAVPARHRRAAGPAPRAPETNCAPDPAPKPSDRELAILQWSADFEDGHAMRHAEQMATPWFGINHDCFEQIWGELRRTWREAELIDACRSFGVPVLIIDGSADLRPRGRRLAGGGPAQRDPGCPARRRARAVPRGPRRVQPATARVPRAGLVTRVKRGCHIGAAMRLTEHERERRRGPLPGDAGPTCGPALLGQYTIDPAWHAADRGRLAGGRRPAGRR